MKYRGEILLRRIFQRILSGKRWLAVPKNQEEKANHFLEFLLSAIQNLDHHPRTLLTLYQSKRVGGYSSPFMAHYTRERYIYGEKHKNSITMLKIRGRRWGKVPFHIPFFISSFYKVSHFLSFVGLWVRIKNDYIYTGH